MISSEQKRTETFLRNQNEKLSAIAASLRGIDISLHKIAAVMERNETMVDRLAEIGEGYPATREELANAGVKEDDNGRTSA